jgi:peptidoglycan/xylan/chitin deacetylase (PgdA/CDA1 family)
MSEYGIEFGSHTLNHKLLHKASDEEVEFEVTESKKKSKTAAKALSSFRLSGGFCTAAAQNAVKRAGYVAAFSTVYGDRENVNLYALNRIEICGATGFFFNLRKRLSRCVRKRIAKEGCDLWAERKSSDRNLTDKIMKNKFVFSAS